MIAVEEPESLAEPGGHVTRIRTHDFELLMGAVKAAEQDFAALCDVLGIEVEPGTAPHDVMAQAVIPAVVHLVGVAREVKAAEKQMLAAASRFDNKTIDLGGGRRGLKVGQRVKGLFDPKGPR